VCAENRPPPGLKAAPVGLAWVTALIHGDQSQLVHACLDARDKRRWSSDGQHMIMDPAIPALRSCVAALPASSGGGMGKPGFASTGRGGGTRRLFSSPITGKKGQWRR
jgi:hypothetical protein